MLNHIVLMGRLTRDPELRRTPQGIAVASFSLAVERDYTSNGGEKQTDFIDIVAWRGTAEFVSRYFTKGRAAIVTGRLQIREWTDNNGSKRRNAEVIADQIYFGDSKRDNASSAPAQYQPGASQTTDYSATMPGIDYSPWAKQSAAGYTAPVQSSDFDTLDGDDDDLPF